MTQLYRRSRSSKERKIIDTSKVFTTAYTFQTLFFGPVCFLFLNLVICDCDDVYAWKEAAVGTAENTAVNLLHLQGLRPW